MPSALLRRAALAAALPVLLGAATAGTALAGPTTATRVDPAAPRAGAPPETTALTLINGDRLLTSADGNGRHSSVVLKAPGSGLSTSLVTLRSGSQELVIPWAALPYLGRGLDPRLFEVGALRRAERDGRLPVTVRYTGRRPALPGVTVTSQAQGLEQGYLTAFSARAFASALAAQMMSDHSHGNYGTDGLFAGGLNISLPGTAPARARPDFKTHTLTVKATNLAGQPDTGDLVQVFNVNDKAVFGVGGEDWLNDFYHGSAKYSAPSGTYWAMALFFKFSKRSADLRMDVLPQFTVAGDTTIRLRARAATSKVTVVTPRRAIFQDRGVTVIRSAHGQVTTGGVDADGAGSTVWVNPTSARPSDGTLQAFTNALLTSPPGRGVPYAYTLNFVGPRGIIPPQHLVARPDSLATISERYYQDVPSQGAWSVIGGTAAQFEDTIFSALALPLNLPGRQVQYVSARPAMAWQDRYWEFADGLVGGQTDVLRVLHGGQHLDEDWNRFPLHVGTNIGGPRFTAALPSAVRAGNNLILDITPFSDNQRGHLGTGYNNGLLPGSHSKITGTYALYQNGKKIAGGDAVKAAEGGATLFAEQKLSSRSSTIRFVLNAARTGRNYRLSTASRDVWTWKSRPQPHAVVPVPWLCGFTPSGRPVQRCAVQPMLTLSYRVPGISLAGTTRPGRQVLDLTVGHLPQAAQSRITRAAVRVSVNGGRTWQRTSIRPAGTGRFQVQFTVLRSREVTLQVTARDATGATITETILGAYRTSA
jgi:hypothetical protein